MKDMRFENIEGKMLLIVSGLRAKAASSKAMSIVNNHYGNFHDHILH